MVLSSLQGLELYMCITDVCRADHSWTPLQLLLSIAISTAELKSDRRVERNSNRPAGNIRAPRTGAELVVHIRFRCDSRDGISLKSMSVSTDIRGQGG